MKTSIHTILVTTAVLSLSVSAQTDYQWINPGGGLFLDSSNWNPQGIPGSSDRVIFGIPSTYPVALDTDWVLSRLVVDGSEADLDLGGQRLDLVWTHFSDDAAVIGDIIGGKILLTNGAIYSGPVTLGRNPGVLGALQVSTGGFWEARRDPDWQGLWIGFNGNADITVDSGGIVRHGHGASAILPGTSARIWVGGGGTWYVDGWFGMGVNGSSSMFVENAGMARAGRCEMGIESEGMARGIIRNGGSWELAAGWETSLTIGQRGCATLEVLDGGQLLNRGYMAIGSEPTGSGQLRVRDAFAQIYRSLGIGGTVDGPGGRGTLRIESGGVLTIGTNGGDFVSVWPGGTLFMEPGSVVQSAGTDYDIPIYLEGTLRGAGMIDGLLYQFNGELTPQIDADNPMPLEIMGTYTLEDPGRLVVELGLSYPGLRILEGAAFLDGWLEVRMAEGYQPGRDETIPILTTRDGVFGRFRNEGSTITFDRGTFDIEYGELSVVLTNFRKEPNCDKPTGDLNDDCRVDLQDLSRLAENWMRCGLTPAELCLPQ